MKFRIVLLSCLLIMVFIPMTSAQDDSLTIVASHSILADVVSNVAGDSASVISLIPPGSDPHSFSPTTGDLAVLADADVLFINGANFEEGLLEAIENAAPDMSLVTASACIEFQEFGTMAQSHDDHEHEQMSENCMNHHMSVDAVYSDMDMSDDEHGMHTNGTNSAIYMSIMNTTENDDTLVAVRAEFANLFEIHETSVVDDIAMMREREDGIEIPAGETVTLQPGGLHIMVMNLQDDLNEGDTVEVMLEFASGTMIAVAVPIAEFEEDAPETMIEAEGFVITAIRGRSAVAMTMDSDDNHDDDNHSDEVHDEDEHDEHDHSGADPHVWTDVHNVMLWTLTIRNTLIDRDPANADAYTANASIYLESLADLAIYVDTQVSLIPAEQRILLTNHDSLGYFAATYDFELIGTVIPGGTTLSEPSAADMAALIGTVREHNVMAIFAENIANTDIAAQIASETGAALYTLYSGALSAADGDAATYLDYMRYNIETIVTALTE